MSVAVLLQLAAMACALNALAALRVAPRAARGDLLALTGLSAGAMLAGMPPG